MQRICLAILFLFLGYFANCQNNIGLTDATQSMSNLNSSGGNASSSSGSVAFSIGQPFYTNISESGKTLSHGVQQVSKAQPSLSSIEYSAQVLAYPNPTTNYLIIDLIDFEDEAGVLQLFNMQGKNLKTIEIKTRAIKVPMDFLSDGIYILRIVVPNRFEKSINIVKI